MSTPALEGERGGGSGGAGVREAGTWGRMVLPSSPLREPLGWIGSQTVAQCVTDLGVALSASGCAKPFERHVTWGFFRGRSDDQCSSWPMPCLPVVR